MNLNIFRKLVTICESVLDIQTHKELLDVGI
jgi:hypothetical protein